MTKFQITNYNHFGHWSLELIWDLGIVICKFEEGVWLGME